MLHDGARFLERVAGVMVVEGRWSAVGVEGYVFGVLGL